MPQEKPPEWRDTRESQEESRATLEKIGKHLQFKFAKIVTEPLPAEIHNLLNELTQKHTRN